MPRTELWKETRASQAPAASVLKSTWSSRALPGVRRSPHRHRHHDLEREASCLHSWEHAVWPSSAPLGKITNFIAACTTNSTNGVAVSGCDIIHYTRASMPGHTGQCLGNYSRLLRETHYFDLTVKMNDEDDQNHQRPRKR